MTQEAPQFSITKHGMRTLHTVLGLQSSSSTATDTVPSPPTPLPFQDTVLIAIDFENIDGIKYRSSDALKCQVGLAVLDTKELSCTALDKAITTHSFVVGPSQYVTNTQHKFMFGKVSEITFSEIRERIESCIPRHRNIVVVGHGMGGDLSALQALEVPLSASTIVLDTLNIAKICLGWGQLSLRNLLSALGCPFDRLHCAGNDAHFTLRALLLIAIAGCSIQEQIQHHLKLDLLRQIATFPLPYPVRLGPLHPKPPTKKWLRLTKKKSIQARSWTAEKQDQIRAARKLRREEGSYFDGVVGDMAGYDQDYNFDVMFQPWHVMTLLLI